MQAWAQQCEQLEATGWAGRAGPDGTAQQPAVFDALHRPLLAAWAAAPAFGLRQDAADDAGTERSAAVKAASDYDGTAALLPQPLVAAAAAVDGVAFAAAAAPPAAAVEENAAAVTAAALQRGAEALAGMPNVQPQLGNMLVGQLQMITRKQIQ